MKGARKIKVHVDSNSFDDLLNKDDRLAIAILRHHDSDYLEFVRSPLETRHDELRNIMEYELRLDGDSKIEAIIIAQKVSDSCIEMAFGYRMENVQSVARKIYQKDKISKNELDRTTAVFIQAVFNQFEKSNIYIYRQ